jgi:hypothetical protein
MISGRGLGHTGGTLDKLESIPGYNAVPNNARFRRTVKEIGCAIIGQTANLAPADKRLYAIRDVTATVESIGLITASILSKKLAAGLGALVMDVKFGSGAFMAAYDDAKKLAHSIVDVANKAGLKTRALLTDMDAPLGRVAGNALEVRDAILFLQGKGDRRTHACTRARPGAGDAQAVSNTVRRFLINHGVAWPSVLNGAALAQTYGVRDIPANFLIGRDGKVIGFELSDQALVKAVAAAVEAK